MFGRLAWEDCPLPENLVWLHLILPLAAAWTPATEDCSQMTWRDRCVIWGVLAVSVLGMGMLLHMLSDPVGHPAIRPLLRGRYWLPLLPLVFIPLQGLRPRGPALLYLIAGGGLAYSLLSVAKRYYLSD
ncbi:TPA: hypothetical protein DDW35_12350 [Candidatus Sumerlaeota bacterium]|jgi:hypothetical protein|nr:hypothetical protein [Candidatus Sumerlaeota bacterium]